MVIATVSLIISILIGIIGQIILKTSVSGNFAPLPIIGVSNYLFIIAAALYFISLLFYTYSLRFIPLQLAFPSVSISYAAVAYLSHVIWGTNFGIKEVCALSLILMGIVLLVPLQEN